MIHICDSCPELHRTTVTCPLCRYDLGENYIRLIFPAVYTVCPHCGKRSFQTVTEYGPCPSARRRILRDASPSAIPPDYVPLPPYPLRTARKQQAIARFRKMREEALFPAKGILLALGCAALIWLSVAFVLCVRSCHHV